VDVASATISLVAGGEVTGEAGAVTFAEGCRNDNVGQVLADHAVSVVAKSAFGGGIEFGDAAFVVHGHDAIEGRIEDCGFIRFTALQARLFVAKPFFD